MLLRPRLRPGDLVLRTGDEPSGKNTTAHGRADRASGTGDEAPKGIFRLRKVQGTRSGKGPGLTGHRSLQPSLKILALFGAVGNASGTNGATPRGGAPEVHRSGDEWLLGMHWESRGGGNGVEDLKEAWAMESGRARAHRCARGGLHQSP